jgi:hypothetical protein
VLDQLVMHFLLQVIALSGQPRHAIDHVLHEVKTVHVVKHGHVEGSRNRSFFLVATYVKVIVICPAVGQAMDQPRVTVIRKDYRFVLSSTVLDLTFVYVQWR